MQNRNKMGHFKFVVQDVHAIFTHRKGKGMFKKNASKLC